MGGEWGNREVVIQLGDDDKLAVWVECPRCGKQHLLDDLEEKQHQSLLCDTFNVRVPFPPAIWDKLGHECLPLRIHARPQPSEPPFSVTLGGREVKIEKRFRF